MDPVQLKANAEAQNDNVSRRIKAIRTEKGISQTELAEKIGVERSNYHRLEKRGEKLTYEMLTKIAQGLGVSVTQLVSDEISDVGLPVDWLRKRTEELEDRIRDKQNIINTYQGGKILVTREIYNTLFETAIDLKLAPVPPIEIASYESLFEVWGEERINDKGEPVLVFGEKFLALTTSDLHQIYEHIHQTKPDYYDLLVTIVLHANILPDGLVKKVLSSEVLKSYVQIRIDQHPSFPPGTPFKSTDTGPITIERYEQLEGKKFEPAKRVTLLLNHGKTDNAAGDPEASL